MTGLALKNMQARLKATFSIIKVLLKISFHCLSYLYPNFYYSMSSPKVQLFPEEMQEAAILFKALSHPARLAILRYLAETKVCMTGDITREVPLGRTTVNQHLTELKNSGLIKGSISGVKVNYCLDQPKIEELKKTFSWFSDLLEQ